MGQRTSAGDGDPAEDADLEQAGALAFDFARAHGSSQREAQLLAERIKAELPWDARQARHQFEAIERLVLAAEPQTLTPEQELFLWNFTDEEELAAILAMRAQGMSEEAIERRVFPYRWDLVRRGRRRHDDQAKYAERMAALADAARLAAERRGDVSDESAQPNQGKRGRRRGSGTFRTPKQFRAAFSTAVGHLKRLGQPTTQENVARYFRQSRDRAHPDCDDRQIRRWLDQFGYPSWEDLLDDLDLPPDGGN